MRIPTIALIAALATAVACSKGGSETSGGEVAAAALPNLTDVDVADYDLDMDKVRKWLNGMAALMSAAKQDSTMAAAIASNGNEKSSETIARMEANPKVKEILDKSGISARDYVLTMSAYLRAAMADAAATSSPKGLAPARVNEDNVEFIRKHRAELEPLLKQAGLET